MTKTTRQKTLYLLLASVSLLVFLIAAAFAATKGMASWEKLLLIDIYNRPPQLHWFGLIVTQLGSAWMLVILSVWLLIGRKRAQHRGTVIVLTGLVTYFMVELAKRLIARPRPAELLAHLVQKEPLVTGYGFPSGHTALATVVSLTLVQYLPRKYRWLPLLWIPLVAWSRLYLGVHAPLDIVGGFSLGLFVISVQRLFKIK